jgi:hypothetical protein
MQRAAIAFAAVAALTGAAAAASPTGASKPGGLAQIPPYVPDHYTCYGVTQLGPTTKVSILLTTQFDAAPVRVLTVRTLNLCAPTSKNGGVITDAADHLDCRQIAVPGAFRARNVLVTNQFGSIVLRVFAPWSLCAPALKSFTGIFPPPPLVRPDHFECYVARYEGIFPKFTVTISNQFEGPTTVLVRKPVQLCAPAVKTVGTTTFPVAHPTVHLVCYELMPRLAAVGPFTVFTNPQFGVHRLVVRQRDTLCLPSTKTLL